MFQRSLLVLASTLSLVLAFACADPVVEDGAGGSGSGGDGSGGDGSGGDGSGGDGSGGNGSGGNGPGGSGGELPPPESAEETLLLEVLAGRISAGDGLLQIAQQGGFPIPTSSGFLFARFDEGRGPWRVAGDSMGWDGIPMERSGDLWWARVPIAEPDGARYKFRDGADGYQADPLARRYDFDENGELSLVAASYAHRERFPAVGAGSLSPRTVRTFVPAGAVIRHLYVHDGQNLWEPDSIFGGWRLAEQLGAGTLAIGIDNTSSRMDEYTHVPDVIEGGGNAIGGNGDAYADFVEETIRPMVEARHGVPGRVGLMGSSLGGLISFHQVLRHRGRYDFAASLSGTFGWGSIGARNETLIERFSAAGVQPTELYLDSGGSDGGGCVDSDADGILDDTPGAGDNYCETRQLADTLAGIGYVWDQDLTHWWEPGAEHNEAAWAARVFRPVQLFEAR